MDSTDIVDDPVDLPVVTAPSANRRTRTATVLSVPALAALAVSAVLFLVPVTNPDVQDCGSPAVFLLRATSDRPLVEQDGTAINGWTKTRIQKAYDNRCSSRVADRAVPAGVALIVFWILGLVAAAIAWSGRRALRRARRND